MPDTPGEEAGVPAQEWATGDEVHGDSPHLRKRLRAAVRVEDDAVHLAASGRDRHLQGRADQHGIVPLPIALPTGPARVSERRRTRRLGP